MPQKITQPLSLKNDDGKSIKRDQEWTGAIIVDREKKKQGGGQGLGIIIIIIVIEMTFAFR